jgi:hypothetical protein
VRGGGKVQRSGQAARRDRGSLHLVGGRAQGRLLVRYGNKGSSNALVLGETGPADQTGLRVCDELVSPRCTIGTGL